MDIFECEWEENDALLLCSDGLYSELNEQDLVGVLEKSDTPDAACTALVELALDSGSQDNVSVVLVKNGEAW